MPWGRSSRGRFDHHVLARLRIGLIGPNCRPAGTCPMSPICSRPCACKKPIQRPELGPPPSLPLSSLPRGSACRNIPGNVADVVHTPSARDRHRSASSERPADHRVRRRAAVRSGSRIPHLKARTVRFALLIRGDPQLVVTY